MRSRPTLPSEFRAAVPQVPFTKQELTALTWAAKQAGSRQPFRAGLDGALPSFRAWRRLSMLG